MTNLKRIREARGMTQNQLAEKSGVNLRSVQNYEQGFKDINKASAITVYQLSKALHCLSEDLLEGIDVL